MTIPLLDLKAQLASIENKMLTAVSQVIQSQVCIGGPKVCELEKTIAAASGSRFAIGVSSGTDAILASLMSLNIGSGDEVITTSFTFFATVGCIDRVGATPVFVDIDPKTFNIDPAQIETAITKKTKAILPVHLFGQMAEMDPILEIAKKHNLHVIEDAAQAIGSSYKGKMAGSLGTTGCFSFYPTKNLGAIGDAGMVVTNDESLAKRLTMMRNHGDSSRYQHDFVGGNFRLDAIQAAVLLVKFPHLDSWVKARQGNAAFYDESFSGSPVQTPYIHPDCTSVYNQYCVRVPNRDGLRDFLTKKNIGCAIYYPVAMHQQKCFAHLNIKTGDFPETEKATQDILALPIYPELTHEMQQMVVDAVLTFYSA
jgi:dTDP-4-amino-4,6-dideoxygalactose transaminase